MLPPRGVDWAPELKNRSRKYRRYLTATTNSIRENLIMEEQIHFILQLTNLYPNYIENTKIV